MKPIIETLLDTDLYKLTMLQAIFHHFSSAENTEFEFKCRTKDINLSQHLKEINKQFDSLCNIKFQDDELNYLKSKGIFEDDFLAFLKDFKLDRENINISQSLENPQEINIIAKGNWKNISLFEIYALSIVNEVYFSQFDQKQAFSIGEEKLTEKIEMIKAFNEGRENKFKIMEFGGRRRFSKQWHEHVTTRLAQEIPEAFIGTSNIALGKKLGINISGTMAHEYLQASQAFVHHLEDSQAHALDVWQQEYKGKLAIALTDVIGLQAFLKDFNFERASKIDGVRHDSGDPFVWGEAFKKHYQSLGINTKDKTLVFSDGLDVPLAISLFERFSPDFRAVIPGIGTNLTNDCGIKAINIVMKMTQCQNQPVAKLSDSPGKTMCKDSNYVELLKMSYDILPKSEDFDSRMQEYKPMKKSLRP